MTLSKVHNLLFGDACHTVLCLDDLCPWSAIDERIDKLADTILIALKRIVVAQLHIVDHRRQQVIAELTLLQLLYLCKQQATNLVKGLSLTRSTHEHKHRVVKQLIVPCACLQHLHLLVDIEVEKSCSTIVKHHVNHTQGIALQ